MGGTVSELLNAVLSWRTLLIAVAVFGVAPGLILRLLVKLYPKGDPRRQELVNDLYHLNRWERLFYVGEQFETALSEGIPRRLRSIRMRRAERRYKKDSYEAVAAALPTYLIPLADIKNRLVNARGRELLACKMELMRATVASASANLFPDNTRCCFFELSRGRSS